MVALFVMDPSTQPIIALTLARRNVTMVERMDVTLDPEESIDADLLGDDTLDATLQAEDEITVTVEDC